jgi:putative transposase
MATRYGLAIVQLPGTDERNVRRAFAWIFRRFGLPKAIQVDNGPPFGGEGALGLTRLSVWWLRLGIRVQFGRPRCPQDNAAHEQWHSVISAETFKPTAPNVRAQQRRFARALHDYNHCRPHESLGMQVPARLYRKSPRLYRPQLPASRYPARWPTLDVPEGGRVSWAGQQRMIGRAFAGQRIGLRPHGAQRWQVYLDRHLIGELVATDRAGMRPAKRKRYRNGSPVPDSH